MKKEEIELKVKEGKQKPSRECTAPGCRRRIRHDREKCSLHDGAKKSGRVNMTLKGGVLADKIRAKQNARKTRTEKKDQKTSDSVGDAQTNGSLVSGVSGLFGSKKNK